MKKENDEITDLFRTRLADAGMSVRDGFWEELSQEIPVASSSDSALPCSGCGICIACFGSLVGYFLVFLSKGGNGRSIYKDSRDEWRTDGWRWNTRQSVAVAGRTGVAETGSEILRYAVAIYGGRRFSFNHFLYVVFFFFHYFYGKWQPIW